MERQQISKTDSQPKENFHPARRGASTRASHHPLHQLRGALGNRTLGQFIQAKLSISQPGDAYEQEADRVADQVMRMPAPLARSSDSTPAVQKKCAACESAGPCPSCAAGEQKGLQRKPFVPQITPLVQRQAQLEATELQMKNDSGHPAMATPLVANHIGSLNVGGTPLPQSVRSFFEPRFGHDFSDVRVHTDERAAQSALGVKARAYTVGHDVVFGSGQYRPDTTSGRTLLAHELAHTIQQQQTVIKAPPPIRSPNQDDQTEDQPGSSPMSTDTSSLPLMKVETLLARDGMDAGVSDAGVQDASTVSAGVPMPDAGTGASGPTATPTSLTTTTPVVPTAHEYNTELGGLSVGNFDFHFRDCGILIWVWVRFQFQSRIAATDQTAFKTRFFRAIHGVWGNSGYHLTGTAACPCRNVPIIVHAQESAPGAYYHKLVDVEREERRESVISDMNLSLVTSDNTMAHEFGHVLGLYDEYDGGWLENRMFWHRNRPDDPSALMNTGSGLRSRYFEHYRNRVQDTAGAGCDYTVSSPTPPVP